MSEKQQDLTKQEFLDLISASGLAQSLATLKQAVLNTVLDNMDVTTSPSDRAASLVKLMHSGGPAAAEAALTYALDATNLKSKYVDGRVPVNVANLVNNESPDTVAVFNDAVQRFLLPRSSSFGTLVDSRHDIELECGFPGTITPGMYRYMQETDDTSSRVNDIYPDESWAVDPVVYDNEDEDKVSDFEQVWQDLCERHNLLQNLYRLDKLCGIGRHGGLLFGFDDKRGFEAPLAGIDPRTGEARPEDLPRSGHGLLYVRPFDEYDCFVSEYELDPNSPRYGHPVWYDVTFSDLRPSQGQVAGRFPANSPQDMDGAGFARPAATSDRYHRRVHWTRMQHAADNQGGSPAHGTPRMQQVFPRLLGLRVIKAASPEMYYKAAWPGIAFEMLPGLVEGEVEIDKDKVREEIRRYSEGLQRFLSIVGVRAKTLSPNIHDPVNFVRVQVEAIATQKGVPLRIFLGSEAARLASTQDKTMWDRRLKRRNTRFVNPFLLRACVDRLILAGTLPRPKRKRYFTDWPDLSSPTDEDKANLALKWTQALSQYVSSGIVHLIRPIDYLTVILGLRTAEARRIIAALPENFMEVLSAAKPASGSGRNGVAKRTASPTSGDQPSRTAADRQLNGMKA